MTSFFNHLRCSACLRGQSSRPAPTVCEFCGRALVAEYDLSNAGKTLRPAAFSTRDGTLWRYRELLPVLDDSSVVSLGEGWTPVLHTKAIGERLGIPKLHIKDEGQNPTGSFKARGISVAVSKAKEFGVKEIAMPSAGNAGGALAAYAAKAGLRAHIFIPRDTPKANVDEIDAYGAAIVKVDGTISDAAARMRNDPSYRHWFDMSTMKEPFRLEGKKTMGYELAEQFQWQLPDVIVYPTGGGTGLIGMWKAFREMETLGWIDSKRPRMISVQASGCAPVVRAFEGKKPESVFWENATTVASGLRVPKAFADHLILSALYESGGRAVAVPDNELLADMTLVASLEGLLLCPEAAAGISALRHLVARGAVHPDDTVLLFNTATGYKYMELFSDKRS